jgi:hypothetical protein
VCNSLDLLANSRAQLADLKGLPLSMRLLSETNQRLMRGVRGAENLPGEVLGAFEKYLPGGDSLPPLVRAGLLHVQFETIHPYLDGNGRIGRLGGLARLLPRRDRDTIAGEAVASAQELFALVAADRARVHEGRSVVAIRLFELLPRHPVVTVASVMRFVVTTKPTAGRAVELLVAAPSCTGNLDRLRVGTDLEVPRDRNPKN